MISGAALSKLKAGAMRNRNLSNLKVGAEGFAHKEGEKEGDGKKNKEVAATPTTTNTLAVSPKVDMFKYIGLIPNVKTAEGLESIADTDETAVNIDLRNKVLNEQENWLNNWYSVRAPKFGLPFKPKEPMAISFLSNQQMGGETQMGKYRPGSNVIEINKEVPGSEKHSTYLHEKNHMYQDIIPGAEENIRTSVWNALYKNYPFGGINAYSGKPDEIHSRIMQLRYEKGLDPNAQITPEMIKKISKEDRKRHNLDIPDEQLMDLLNKTVSVQKKDNSNLA